MTENIGFNMEENKIKCVTKQMFKNIVKTKVQKAAFEYLMTLKNTHSKMKNLNYTVFEKAEYLSSPLFNSESRKLLLALRTRTVSGIRSDYGALYSDKMCPLGCEEADTLQNILSCSILIRETQKRSDWSVQTTVGNKISNDEQHTSG